MDDRELMVLPIGKDFSEDNPLRIILEAEFDESFCLANRIDPKMIGKPLEDKRFLRITNKRKLVLHG